MHILYKTLKSGGTKDHFRQVKVPGYHPLLKGLFKSDFHQIFFLQIPYNIFLSFFFKQNWPSFYNFMDKTGHRDPKENNAQNFRFTQMYLKLWYYVVLAQNFDFLISDFNGFFFSKFIM